MGFRPSKPSPSSSNPSGGGIFNLGEMFGGPGANEYFGKDPGMVEDMPNGSTTDNPYNKPSLLNRIFAPQSSAAADAANAGYKIQSVLSKQEAGQQLANGLQLAEAHARHGADQAIRIQQAADAIKTKHEDEANTYAGRIAADNFPELIPQGAVTKDGSWDYKAVGSMARQIAPLMFGQQGVENGVMGMDRLAAQNAEAISKANLLKQQNEDPRQITSFQAKLAADTAASEAAKAGSDVTKTDSTMQLAARKQPDVQKLISQGYIGGLNLANAKQTQDFNWANDPAVNAAKLNMLRKEGVVTASPGSTLFNTAIDRLNNPTLQLLGSGSLEEDVPNMVKFGDIEIQKGFKHVHHPGKVAPSPADIKDRDAKAAAMKKELEAAENAPKPATMPSKPFNPYREQASLINNDIVTSASREGEANQYSDIATKMRNIKSVLSKGGYVDDNPDSMQYGQFYPLSESDKVKHLNQLADLEDKRKAIISSRSSKRKVVSKQ